MEGSGSLQINYGSGCGTRRPAVDITQSNYYQFNTIKLLTPNMSNAQSSSVKFSNVNEKNQEYNFKNEWANLY